jgi:hypothetical protein
VLRDHRFALFETEWAVSGFLGAPIRNACGMTYNFFDVHPSARYATNWTMSRETEQLVFQRDERPTTD